MYVFFLPITGFLCFLCQWLYIYASHADVYIHFVLYAFGFIASFEISVFNLRLIYIQCMILFSLQIPNLVARITGNLLSKHTYNLFSAPKKHMQTMSTILTWCIFFAITSYYNILDFHGLQYFLSKSFYNRYNFVFTFLFHTVFLFCITIFYILTYFLWLSLCEVFSSNIFFDFFYFHSLHLFVLIHFTFLINFLSFYQTTIFGIFLFLYYYTLFSLLLHFLISS